MRGRKRRVRSSTNASASAVRTRSAPSIRAADGSAIRGTLSSTAAAIARREPGAHMILWRRFGLTRVATDLRRDGPDRDRRRCFPSHPFRTRDWRPRFVAARVRSARARGLRGADGRARRPAGVRRSGPRRGVLDEQGDREHRGGERGARGVAPGRNAGRADGDRGSHRHRGGVRQHRSARAGVPDVRPAVDGRRRHLY